MRLPSPTVSARATSLDVVVVVVVSFKGTKFAREY